LIPIVESERAEEGILDRVSGFALGLAVWVATVQIFSSVTPERGLLNVCFNIFYLLILLNDIAVAFSPRRLAGALLTMLGASFVLKYLVLTELFAPTSSWGKYVLQELMRAGSLGLLDQEPFAPLTGYLAFLSLALYFFALYLIAPRLTRDEALLYRILSHRHRLTESERIRLLSIIVGLEPGSEQRHEAGDNRATLVQAERVQQVRGSLPSG
jgi:hypothetical protein